MPKVKIFQTITAISFNGDGSQVALCAGEQEVYIYDTNGSKEESKWTLKHTLKEHTMKATAIDWNHETGLIVTGSYDRSIFVWKYNETLEKYEPQFVVMDEKLAILTLKWSKKGDKFVVGTSSKEIYVGYWMENNNWWATANISKQHKSSVLSCEFSPNGKVIASASFDGTCKIISACIKGLDEEEAKGPFGTQNGFGQ